MTRAALAVLAVLVAASTAHAGDRCADLQPTRVVRLSERGHDRIAGALRFDDGKARDWSKVVVTVEIARAPHLAPAILATCPGVLKVFNTIPRSARRFDSAVRVRVAGFAVLTRLAQLPAVVSMSVFDPKEPATHFEFDDDFE